MIVFQFRSLVSCFSRYKLIGDKPNGQFSAMGCACSCIHNLGPDICLDEYKYHDSLWARHIREIDHLIIEDHINHEKSERILQWIIIIMD